MSYTPKFELLELKQTVVCQWFLVELGTRDGLTKGMSHSELKFKFKSIGPSQLTFTFSKSAIEKLQKGVKYVSVTSF